MNRTVEGRRLKVESGNQSLATAVRCCAMDSARPRRTGAMTKPGMGLPGMASTLPIPSVPGVGNIPGIGNILPGQGGGQQRSPIPNIPLPIPNIFGR